MNTLIGLWIVLFGVTVQSTTNTTTIYEDVRHAVKREFGYEADLALAVFTAESNLRAGAVGDHGNSFGVAQVHVPSHGKKIPVADKAGWLKNFQNNLRLAKRIRNESGWNAWTTYRDNTYKLYLEGQP